MAPNRQVPPTDKPKKGRVEGSLRVQPRLIPVSRQAQGSREHLAVVDWKEVASNTALRYSTVKTTSKVWDWR